MENQANRIEDGRIKMKKRVVRSKKLVLCLLVRLCVRARERVLLAFY